MATTTTPTDNAYQVLKLVKREAPPLRPVSVNIPNAHGHLRVVTLQEVGHEGERAARALIKALGSKGEHPTI